MNKKSAKKSKKKKGIRRHPRPMGVTYLCQQLNQQDFSLIPANPQSPPQKNLRNRIEKLYIQNYLNEGQLIKDKITGSYRLIATKELADILLMTEIELMSKIARELGRVGNMLDEGNGQIARGLGLRLLNLGLETQAQSSLQLGILMAKQGSKYVPFLTAEVNKAMANKIAALKPNIDLLKVLLDKQSSTMGLPNINAQNGQPTSTNGNNILTVDVAHKMLNDVHQSAITDAEVLAYISNDLAAKEELPEVNPNYQGGDILRGQSLTKGAPEATQIPTKTHRKRQSDGYEDIEDEDEFIA